MEQNDSTVLNIFVTSAGSELGRETVRQLVARGHRVSGQVKSTKDAASVRADGARVLVADPLNAGQLTKAVQSAAPDILLNLIPQETNTLLHDGQKWGNYDLFLPSTTRNVVAAAKAAGVKFMVQTSYAFLYGNAQAATEEAPLNPPNSRAFRAAIQAEKMIADNAEELPSCLLRLGFLYGPQSHDLKLYEDSFNLFRPYYAGPNSNRSNFLHYEDAALALVLVAEKQPAGETFNVVDGHPASFGDFIDTFAHYLGRLRPLHIPTWSGPLASFLIKPEQQDLLELTALVSNAKIQEKLGWQPRYKNYQQGLAQIVRSWRSRTYRVSA